MARRFAPTQPEGLAGLVPERTFLAACALLFLACVAGTIYWARSMSASMAMPGAWTAPMVWVKVPGQNWPEAIATFLEMWIVMMAAMMLPMLVPTLVRYRRGLRGNGVTRTGGLAALAGAGYFSVWALLGAVIYVPGVLLTAAETQSMTLAALAPFATGIILLAAGCLQLSAWKVHQLTCDLNPQALGQNPSQDPPSSRNAWQYGLRLGLHCSRCCSGLMLMLLVTGLMDLRVMAAVAIAITLEQLAPAPAFAARTIGVIAILAGIFIFAQALGWHAHLLVIGFARPA